MNRLRTLIVVCLLIQGCASTQPPAKQTTTARPTQDIYALLSARHDAWEGVIYLLGGTDSKGIDCSAFVQLTFRELFGMEIPRTTEMQAQYGTEISRADMQVGDLVFFNTTSTVRHVGIYMGAEKILHASTRHGVTISDMQYYWAPLYWKSMRAR